MLGIFAVCLQIIGTIWLLVVVARVSAGSNHFYFLLLPPRISPCADRTDSSRTISQYHDAAIASRPYGDWSPPPRLELGEHGVGRVPWPGPYGTGPIGGAQGAGGIYENPSYETQGIPYIDLSPT